MNPALEAAPPALASPGPKPKALILLSAGTVLPLSEPAGHPGLSTGFFLIELAQILAEFGADHDFTFATPDGAVPQLDINGLALAWHAVPHCGAATARAGFEQAMGFDVDRYRSRRTALIGRRNAELELAYRHLGRLPVSSVLPNTDREAALLRDGLVATFAALPERAYLSARQLVERHRDPADPFRLGDFAFVHMPGGHAPIDRLRRPPLAGRAAQHPARGGRDPLPHLPRAGRHGLRPVPGPRRRRGGDEPEPPLRGRPAHHRPPARRDLRPHRGLPQDPRQADPPAFYVDEALKAAGYRVRTTLNPAAVKVVWDDKAKLLTGNGPQAVDEQAAQLRRLVEAGRARAAAGAA